MRRNEGFFMNKRVLSLFFAVGLLCMSAAFAGAKDFSSFSADVPEGWVTNEAGGMVVFMSQASKCVVTVAVQESGGIAAKDIAEGMVASLKGASASKMEGSEGYQISANVSGVPTNTRVYANDKVFLLFSVAGDEAGNKDAVDAIWKSLNSNDAKVKALLGK